MDNWKLIADSRAGNPYINMVVNGVQTLAVKKESGLTFSLLVREQDISAISSTAHPESFVKDTCIPGGREICRFSINDTCPYVDTVNIPDNEQIRSHVSLSISSFLKT